MGEPHGRTFSRAAATGRRSALYLSDPHSESTAAMPPHTPHTGTQRTATRMANAVDAKMHVLPLGKLVLQGRLLLSAARPADMVFADRPLAVCTSVQTIRGRLIEACIAPQVPR
eukprot:1733800-Prymnesium_polylepis.1